MADIARIADEVIDVCKLGTYCRGTLLGALREVADESKARIAALEEALRWYQQEAEAMAKYLPAKNAEAVTAICTVLSLDAGNRAKRALSASPLKEQT